MLNMPEESNDMAVLDRLNMYSYDLDHRPFVKTAKDMHKNRECAFNDSSELEEHIQEIKPNNINI